MSGKLKIIRVLSNPIRKRTKKKSALQRSRKQLRRRRSKSAAGKFVLRVVTPDSRALWRTRTGWTKSRKDARTFATEGEAEKAFKASYIAKRDNWTVADVLPA